MAIFDSSNPTLKEKTFEQSIAGSYQGEAMTLTGTLNKFGILMALLIASTLFAWDQFNKGSDPVPFMMVGVFGGMVMALVMAMAMAIAMAMQWPNLPWKADLCSASLKIQAFR